jgi:hypothetical protein
MVTTVIFISTLNLFCIKSKECRYNYPKFEFLLDNDKGFFGLDKRLYTKYIVIKYRTIH